MRRRWDGEPIPERFAGALGLGALAGGFLTPIWLAVADGLMVLGLAIIVIPVAAIVWMIGLVVIGFPAWVALHHFGFRSMKAALALGVAVLLPAFFWSSPTPEGLFQAASFVAMGPAVACIVWRHAYGKSAA